MVSRLPKSQRDVSRLARLSAAKGGKTRAIVKLLGRAAIVLAASAFDLAIWLLWAALHAARLCLVLQSHGRAHDAALSQRRKLRALAVPSGA